MALGKLLYGMMPLGLMVVRSEASEEKRITLGFMIKC